MKEETLTEKQEKFVEALLGAAQGDPRRAIKIAGYADGTNPYTVMNSKAVAKAIAIKVDNKLSLNLDKAMTALLDVLEDPTQLGGALKVKVAETLLDRGGIPKRDSLHLTTDEESSILLLPQKLKLTNEGED